eukprot:g772.t1
MSEAISVSIRVRPVPEGSRTVFSCYDEQVITQTEPDERCTPVPNATFRYDNVFDPSTTTQAVYEKVAQRIVNGVVDGINGTMFAYGQTASGKTFTMQGGGDSPGVLQLAATTMFKRIEQAADREFLIRCSYVEIYNEEIKDLINPRSKVKIREDPRTGMYIDCKEELIGNFDQVLEVLRKGERARSVGVTKMNEHSSRSHTIFRLVVESRQRQVGGADEVDGGVLAGTLNLVDLAGSESVRLTGAEGQRLKEAGNINKSLLTLSRVIQTLGEAAKQGIANPHVSFRDSKLTRLLQPSLAGNTRTAIICCISPRDKYLEETLSTLKFAGRASSITTKAEVNELLDAESQLKRLKKELKQLKAQQEGRQGASVEELEKLKSEHGEMAKQLAERDQKIGVLKMAFLEGGTSTAKTLTPGGGGGGRAQRRRRKRETWCPGEGGFGGGEGGDDEISFGGAGGRMSFGLNRAAGGCLLGALDEVEEDAETDRSASTRRGSSPISEAASVSRASIGSVDTVVSTGSVGRVADLERQIEELRALNDELALENKSLAGFASAPGVAPFVEADEAEDETKKQLENEVAGLRQEVAELREANNAKDESIVQLQEQAQDVDELTQQTAALRDQIREAEESKASADAATEELQGRLAAAEDKAGNCEAASVEALANVAALEQASAEQLGKVAQLEGAVAALESDKLLVAAALQEKSEEVEKLQAQAAMHDDDDDDDVTAEISSTPDLSETVAALEQRVEELQQECGAAQARCSEAELQCATKLQKAADEHARALTVQEEALTASKEQLATRTSELEAQIAKASQATADRSEQETERVSALQAQLSAQLQEVATMEDTIIKAAEDSAALRAKVEAHEQATAAEKARADKLEQHNLELMDKADALLKEATQAQREKEEQSDSSATAAADMEKSLAALASEKAQLEASAAELQLLIRAKDQQLSEQQSASSELGAMGDQLRQAEQQRDELQAKIDGGVKQVRKLKGELEKANSLRRRQWDEHMDQQSAAEDEIEKLGAQKSALEEELVTVKTKLRALSTELAVCKEELTKTQKRCVHLDARKLTKEQCASLMKVKREHKQLKVENRELKKQVQQRGESTESKQQLEELQGAHEALVGELSSAQSALRRMEHEQQCAAEANAESEATVAQLKAEIHDRDVELRALQSQRMSAEQRAEHLGTQEQNLASAKDKLEEELAGLSQQLAQQQQQVQFLESEMEIVQGRETEATRKNAKLERELQDARSAAEVSTAEHTRTVGFLEQENLQLMLELKTLHGEHRLAQANMAKTSERMQLLQDELVALRCAQEMQAHSNRPEAAAQPPAPPMQSAVVNSQPPRNSTPLRSLGSNAANSAFKPTPKKKSTPAGTSTPDVATNKSTPSTAQLVGSADELLAAVEAEENGQPHCGAAQPLVDLHDADGEESGECTTQ